MVTNAVAAKRSMNRTRIILKLFLLFTTAAAQTGGLYDADVPIDAAFVRVIHALPGAPGITATVGGGFREMTAEFGTASSYHIALEGTAPVVVQLGEESLELALDVLAERFYSVALIGTPEDPELIVIEDEFGTDLTRALLSLYNLSEIETLDLKTSDGEIEVVTSVGFAETEGTLVNPVRVDLGVFDEDTLIETLEGVQLEAGEAYSVIVSGPAEALTVYLARAALD